MKPGRADPAAESAQQGRGPDQPDQCRHSSAVQARRCRARASPQADYIVEREFNTAMVHQGYIEPHNAVGDLQLRWPRDDLLLDPGHFRRALAVRAGARHARGQYQRRPGRNRRRLRRQADDLSGAARAAAVEEDRPSGEAGHDAREVLRATGPTSGSHHPMQNGRDQRRQNDRRARSGWPTKRARFRARRSARAR